MTFVAVFVILATLILIVGAVVAAFMATYGGDA